MEKRSLHYICKFKLPISCFYIHGKVVLMPHLRERHIAPSIKKSLAFSPMVGVVGHRQVGKTTLLEYFSKTYVSLDRGSVNEQATTDPERFVSGFNNFPVGLDECQLSPPLFPALKERVRQVKRPGQFLLSGSVRFGSRKAIRESLTGRILLLELLPMTVSELCQKPIPQLLTKILLAKTQKAVESFLDTSYRQAKKAVDFERVFESSMKNGGLPGVCFIRNGSLQRLKWESQLETILTRDLELISETNLSLQTKKSLLAELARKQGLPLSYVELSRKCRISIPALKKLILAFEGLFLVRTIPCKGGERRPVIFLEDQGEAQHLTENRIDTESSFTNTLYMNIRVPFLMPLGAMESPAAIFQFRTRGGAFVPFAFESGRHVVGILPSLEEQPSKSVLGSAQSFLKAFPYGRAVIIHPFSKCESLGEGLFLVPCRSALI